ncbi:phosphoinositide phosphatase SAC2 [Trifolium repens]|nr:phosphoinositide phosphatase SAC2 [Trifolium repens]
MLIIKEIEVDDYSGYNEIKDYIVKPKMLQKGVLRTNCIDRLDRTNVAQYAYELVALGRQLQALEFIESLHTDLDIHLEKEIMATYESIGDTLLIQICRTLVLKG